ncbi:MAG: hypothetical protein R2752_19555 [Vicinamibacterales bacterium]
MTVPAAPPPSPGTRRAVVLATAAWTLGVTIARAARWPNDFAEAHWLLDYRFGFVKRGLVGELVTLALAPFGAAPTERLIDGLSVAIFVLLAAVLAGMAIRLVRAAAWSPQGGLVALALLSSPFVVMSAHLVGYFDHLLFLFSAGAIALLLRGRPWAGAAVQAMAVLVHESAIVYGAPVFALAWLLRETDRRAGDESIAGLARRALPLAVPVAAFVLVAVAGRYWQAPDFQDQFSRRLAGFPFVGGDMHLFVPEWLAPSFFDQYAEQARRFPQRIAFAEAYGLVLPTSLALFTFGVTVFRGRLPRLVAAVMAVACLVPQLLHLAAWDTIRIWTCTIGAAGLAAWAIARHGMAGTAAETAVTARPTGEASAPRTAPATTGTTGTTEATGTTESPEAPETTALRWVALSAIVVNVMAMTPLLDNLADRFTLSTRLWLYAPTLAVALALTFTAGRHR